MASGNAIAASVPIPPNGDFEAGAAGWTEASGGGSFLFSYPTTGGNPNGYGVIDNTGAGGFGIWVANGGNVIPLADLGLTAGQTYTFKQDMITLVAGVGHKGGIKIESWAGGINIGDSGDMYATTGSAAWATYSFDYTILPGAEGIKVVPLWGENASVGYDNFRVENVPITPPPPPPPSPIIPNFDFEQLPAGTKWAFFQGGGQTNTFPATGGNPNGYAVIDSVGFGNWAVMVSNSNGMQSLSSLGLNAGQSYTFTQDMKILAGTNIGGLKVEFNPSGDTGDIYPVVIGDGTEWATYSFVIPIPTGTVGLKVTPLWGPDSRVGYDNIKIVLPNNLPAPTIKLGTLVSWTAAGAANTYQPQKSSDNITYTNLGPAITGNAVTSVFDLVKSPFYQVLQTTPESVTTILPATSAAGVEVRFLTIAGVTYQVESSDTLLSWANFGASIGGDGLIKAVTGPISQPKKSYRVRSTP